VLPHCSEFDEELFAQAFAGDMRTNGIDPSLPRAMNLGRLATSERFMWTKRFGLDQLFDSIPAQRGVESLSRGMTPRELISLTGSADVFGVMRIVQALGIADGLSAKIAELEKRKQDKAETGEKHGALGRWLAKRS
jgi:hypothetical protein